MNVFTKVKERSSGALGQIVNNAIGRVENTLRAKNNTIVDSWSTFCCDVSLKIELNEDIKGSQCVQPNHVFNHEPDAKRNILVWHMVTF